MNFVFQNKDLAGLYHTGKGSEDYPESVIKAFFKKMQLIKYAKHEGDIWAIKSNHFEKLKGREDDLSIRLNEKYRLIFQIESSGERTLIIKEISNHYD